MRKTILLMFAVFLATTCKSQEIGAEYADLRIYKSLRKALRNESEVQYLQLSNLGMEIVPEDLARLKNLRVLNLDRNSIKSFPDSFWQLDKLEVLIITRNNLDDLPENIGRLKSLRKLYVSRNNLTSLPNSIANLKELKRLDASYNKLTEKDAESIRKALPGCFVIVDVIL